MMAAVTAAVQTGDPQGRTVPAGQCLPDCQSDRALGHRMMSTLIEALSGSVPADAGEGRSDVLADDPSLSVPSRLAKSP